MIPCRRVVLAFALVGATRAFAAAWITGDAQPGDFPLAAGDGAAPIVYAAGDFKVVDLAAHDLAADIRWVTGVKHDVRTDLRDSPGPVVIVGTLGKSPALDAIVAAHKLDVSALRGAWESFLIATVAEPLPGVSSALVIAGSDRRGTAFGVYELSQAIGVSPWHWWADVAPEKKTVLRVAPGTRRFGPPSVKYRGIFLNDEDWGLQPWAAKNFEPEHGSIGPKTYAKIFELLLRLKANTLWPAMHPCTKPFNAVPENAPLADDYAIVMGSSHAEPMLRNNVGEWPHDRAADYNYVTNRDGVLKYWEERVAANGRFENIYTLGMRGIHDSAMQGPKTDAERIATLERIFADQRALLAQHARPEGAAGELQADSRVGTQAASETRPHLNPIPQIFCAYKEVLPLYRGGLRVPDDVTVMFPDDNFGYVRDFPSAAERTRAGGFGVYYHLSYLGAPLSYLWLCSTPPALVWEEMTKAYDHGACTIWIVNVGDLKPAEIGTEFFLQLAWDIGRWRRDNLDDFLRTWAAREFGAPNAGEIAAILRDYYRLNFQRKPEHLQWWLPKEAPRPSALNDEELRARIAACRELERKIAELSPRTTAAQRDAFFELVGYPVRGAVAANLRFLLGETGDIAAAREANETLQRLTAEFNTRTAGGKWRGIINLEPADEQWKSFRIARWEPPKSARPSIPDATPGGFVSLEAEHFTRKVDRAGAAWEIIPGLGRTGEGSVAIFPTTASSLAPEKIALEAPRLDYDVRFATAGEFPVTVYLVPTHPLAGGALRFALALDDAPPQLVALEFKDGGADWARGVLDAARTATAKLAVPSPGAHTLKIFMVDAGVVLDKLVVDCGGLAPSYFGPPESRESRAAMK